MRLAILLTGTVRPSVKGGSFSVEERMNMYTSTLRFYAKTIGTRFPIVFVENSDVDLSCWSSEFCDSLDLEVLQFVPNTSNNDDFDNSQGKGYNEYLMIKKGISTSESLNKCTHFLKITGRYSMVNILNIIDEVYRRAYNKVFFGDIKDTKLYEFVGRKNTDSGHWGDSRFFVADIEFYKKEMLDCYKEMNDYNGNNAESYIFRLSKKFRNDPRFLFRFRNQVQFDGVCGLVTTDFSESYNSPKARLKNYIRHMLRGLFPNVWF